jgi:hypothetical protein
MRVMVFNAKLKNCGILTLREGRLPIIAILLDVRNYMLIISEVKRNGLTANMKV